MNPFDELKHLSDVWARLTDVRPIRGRGIYLYDQQGNRYTDFTSGLGVVNTGHCHPKIVEAVRKQAQELLFAQMNCVVSPMVIELSKKLNDLTPESITQFFFSNSGAEATEAAIKLAKVATKRSNVIVFQGSFHGRTHLAMSMTTSKTIYRRGFQPLLPGIFVAPYPYPYLYGWEEETTIEFCKKQLQQLLHGQTSPSETAAIIIEPVLGEGGYIPAPTTFLEYLREVCNAHGILLIIDEVQTGFGRTGKFFCFEYSAIEPDILVMGKGLGSGLPIAAIGSSQEIMSNWSAGSHGGTYGGGSLIPIVASIATVDVIQSEKLVDNANIQGYLLNDALIELKSKHPSIVDLRAKGLMVGIEFKNAQIAKKVQSYCIENRLLLLTCGTYSNTIRWIPPLVVSSDELLEALTIFENGLIESTKQLH